MKIDTFECKAYDIGINENNERFIDIYQIISERDEKDIVYKKYLITQRFFDDLESGVKEIRKEGYRSLVELGFPRENMDCDTFISCLVFTLFGNRIKALEKIYFPDIIEEMSCIIGAINFVDVITGKEYVVRVKNFGIESNQLIEIAEMMGYKHISKTSLKNQHDKLDSVFVRKLEFKKK